MYPQLYWTKLLNICCLFCLVFSLGCTHTVPPQNTAVPSQPQTAHFEEIACSDLSENIPYDENTRCGYLYVPETHHQPQTNFKKLRLAFVIYESIGENPQPDPLFIAQGGPGGSTIETYTHLLVNSPLRRIRDIVLFDQRGTLHSDPALTCPEIHNESLNNLQNDLPQEEKERLSLQAAKACYDRLSAQGIDLSVFNSLENAADIETLRTTLGYQRINLYGVSYGTLLALHTMRHFPTSLRSVILDAVAPPQTNFIAELPRSADNAFSKLFNSCQEEEACSQAYPDLERVFFKTVDLLNQLPTHLQLTHPKTQQKYKIILDGDTFQTALFRLLYATPFLPALPKLIHDVSNGDYDFFSTILSLLVFDDSTSIGMFFSVICAEYSEFSPTTTDIRPHIAQEKSREAANLLKVCSLWKVKHLTPSMNTPVKSDIPTLMLSGAFDPITPESFALSAAQTLTRSYSFTFPNVGHGVMLSGECQDQIIDEFLQNPLKPPEASCLISLNPPQFYTSATVINLPILIRLLNLQGLAWVQVGILWLCLLVLLSAPAVYFTQRLLPLWQASQPNIMYDTTKSKIPASLKLIQWLAIINGINILVFSISFVIIIIMLISTNDIRLYFGIPASYKPLFVLPIITLLSTLAMCIIIIRAWLLTKWGKTIRIYYTLLSVISILLLAIWHLWGILGA